jgi:hypothetical protein
MCMADDSTDTAHDFSMCVTLSLLMSYIYGAPCKARNFNVIYTWTYVWQCWKQSLSICCAVVKPWINAESYPVSQLGVNTLLATKVTLITDGIWFGMLRVNFLSFRCHGSHPRRGVSSRKKIERIWRGTSRGYSNAAQSVSTLYGFYLLLSLSSLLLWIRVCITSFARFLMRPATCLTDCSIHIQMTSIVSTANTDCD